MYDKYLEVKARHANAQLAAYSTVPRFVELHGFCLIDYESKILDIAILSGQEDRVELPDRFFIPYERAYLADPKVGEMVCIVGYPSLDPRAAGAALNLCGQSLL